MHGAAQRLSDPDRVAAGVEGLRSRRHPPRVRGGVVSSVGDVLQATPPLVPDDEVDRAAGLLARGTGEAAAAEVGDARVAHSAGR
jgi:hypothetical protein